MIHLEDARLEEFKNSPVFKNCRNCIRRHIRNIADTEKRRIFVIQEIAIAIKTLHEQSIYDPSCYSYFEAIMKDFAVDNPKEIWDVIPGAGLHTVHNGDLSAEIIAFVDSIADRTNWIIKK